MSISVMELLEEKAKRFGASTAQDDFVQLFLDSTNYALDDIDERLGLSTARVTDTDSSISLDEQMYRATLSIGIDWYITDTGEWNVKDQASVERRWEKKLKMLHVRYMRDQAPGVRFGSLTS